MKIKYTSPTISIRDFSVSVEKWLETSADLFRNGCFLPVQFKVNGNSMFPFIRRDKDIVTLVPLYRKPQISDVVLFRAQRAGGNYVLHRIYKIKGDMICTCGDACPKPDGWISRDDLLGVAIRIQRGNRKIDCDGNYFKIISCIWRKIFPIRRFLMLFKYMRNLPTKIVHAFKRMFNT